MPNWRDTLPDDLKGNEALANFADITDLAKGFIDTKALQGASIKIPGSDAGTEAIADFHTKVLEKVPTLMFKPDMDKDEQSVEFYRSLGMPETKDKYEAPEFKQPDGSKFESAKLEEFKGIAHKHGLTAKQFKGVMSDIIAQDIAAVGTGQEAVAANQKATKDKFGHAHDDNMAKINNLLTKTQAPEGLVEAAKNGTLDLATVEWMYSMGKQMGGENFDFDTPGDDDKRGGPKMTPADAQTAIDEINANRDHPYWKGTGDEKKRATERMVQLMKFAHPDAPTVMTKA